MRDKLKYKANAWIHLIFMFLTSNKLNYSTVVTKHP